jgi:crossover junction endodeoxyribonuclease RuvC
MMSMDLKTAEAILMGLERRRLERKWSCVFDAPVRAHSEKPDAVLERIEQLFPHLTKIELHRRGQPPEGRDAWGDVVPGAAGRKIIGIDIGLEGAVAVLDMEATLLAVEDMPALADGSTKRRTINSILLAAILREHAPPGKPIEHAYIEFVSARPGEGAVGAFAFGRCRGIVEGVCGALSIPVSFITPTSWKRAVGLPPGVDKDRSRSMAIARWSSHAEDFKRVKDDGRADATLIGVAGLMRAGKLK